jgi:glutamine amidotransferase
MIVVIDYDIGNTGSVINALDKLGAKSIISKDPEIIKKSTALILPGVGAAGQGMRNLRKQGLDRVIIDEINELN